MIHPNSVVHPEARIGPGVSIGAFSVIGAQAEIGEGTWIGSHVVVDGRIRIGARNRIFHFASIGGPPQDKKYAGEDTSVEIGDDNTIRECVTINRGTVQDVGVTRIGADNWIMAYVHVAHDCQIGDHTIFANLTQLAGHVHIADWAILGGSTLVHQFVHVGAHSFSAMGSALAQDLPPYVMASGNPAKPHGINSEGLRRRGYSADAIQAIKRGYRTLYRSGLPLDDARREIERQGAEHPELLVLSGFLGRGDRGILR